MTTLPASLERPGGGRGSASARGAALGARYPIALVGFGVVMFSTGPVMVAATSVSGVVFSFWRLWIGVVLLAVLSSVHVRVTGTWPSRRGLGFAAAAGAAFGLHQLLFMTALKQTSVVDVTLMNTLAPIVVAVLAVPLFGERPGASFRLWSFAAIAGAAAVALVGSSGPEGEPLGMALAAGNVVFYAFYFVWSKQGRDHIDTIPFLFVSVVVAAVIVSGFVVVVGAPVGAADGADLVMATLVALVPGLVGHFAVTWPLRSVPANIPPVLMLLIPVLSGLLAWVLLGEAVDGLTALAGAVTLVGVAGAVLSGRDLVAVEALDLAEES
jgi:drug/metabolite transporter (DMT)-like permease